MTCSEFGREGLIRVSYHGCWPEAMDLNNSTPDDPRASMTLKACVFIQGALVIKGSIIDRFLSDPDRKEALEAQTRCRSKQSLVGYIACHITFIFTNSLAKM
jgi:hypothetical protein